MTKADEIQWLKLQDNSCFKGTISLTHMECQFLNEQLKKQTWMSFGKIKKNISSVCSKCLKKYLKLIFFKWLGITIPILSIIFWKGLGIFITIKFPFPFQAWGYFFFLYVSPSSLLQKTNDCHSMCYVSILKKYLLLIHSTICCLQF